MKKADLIDLMVSKKRSKRVTAEIVDATFEQLSSMLNLDQGLTIEGIGIFDMHDRRGTSKKNHSIFFHPDSEVRREVKKVEDE